MSRPNPTASIVIPNYNHAQYVGDAIRSVLDQTCHDHEIIVVDDGSQDNSRDVIEGFCGRVRAIYQHNQGLSAARNTGIRAAQGRYVGVLDADDTYEPEFISTLSSILENRPDADGIYCGYRFVDHLNNPLPQIEARELPPERLFQALVDGNFLVPEAMFVRKACYDKVGGFDTSLRALEDLDMWLRITRQFKIICTTKVLTRHRVLPGSMSTDPTRQFENRLHVVDKHFGAWPGPGGVSTAAQRRAYGRAYLASAVEYLQAHDEIRAFDCILAMVDACPDLLTQVETFFELGCGDQPKGYRGEFASVNVERNYQVVMRLLERLSERVELEASNDLLPVAYANAHYAFGLIAYGQDKSREARKLFFNAVTYQPGLVFDPRVVGLLLRSLLGSKTVHRLKRLLGGSK